MEIQTNVVKLGRTPETVLGLFFFKLSCGGRRGRSSTNGEVGSSIACYIYTLGRDTETEAAPDASMC